MSVVGGRVLTKAVKQWKKVLGNKHVIVDPSALDQYGNNVSGLTRRLLAILRPASTLQVQSLVRIANLHKTPLYPLSGGKNWGLGSRLPVKDGAVIVDLSRMNRIREVNVDHHYAVIEAGVTQGQLYDHLVQQHLPLVLNTTGAGLSTSLIGNTLERGIGYFSTRADSLSGMEVVLGNGEILQLGYAHFPNSKITHTYRYGIGPQIDGLFFQSNYGIVTAAGFELTPRPEAHVAIIASLYEEKKLAEYINTLASLRKNGVIQNVIHIGNKSRMEITLSPLIYETLKNGHSDSQNLRKQTTDFLAARGFSSWSAIIGLLGTTTQLSLARREIKRQLGKLAQISVMTDQSLKKDKQMIQKFSSTPHFQRKKIMLKATEPLYQLTKGIPTDAALGSLYWPIGEMPPSHGKIEPDQSPCGMLFCLPVMPLKGKWAVETMRQTERIFSLYGFVPSVTLNILDTRNLEAVITLAFDRRKADQIGKAHRCIEKTQQYFIDEGFLPYRVGIQSMSQVVKAEDPFWKMVRDLKQTLDPNHIIAPGRYNLV